MYVKNGHLELMKFCTSVTCTLYLCFLLLYFSYMSFESPDCFWVKCRPLIQYSHISRQPTLHETTPFKSHKTIACFQKFYDHPTMYMYMYAFIVYTLHVYMYM